MRYKYYVRTQWLVIDFPQRKVTRMSCSECLKYGSLAGYVHGFRSIYIRSAKCWLGTVQIPSCIINFWYMYVYVQSIWTTRSASGVWAETGSGVQESCKLPSTMPNKENSSRKIKRLSTSVGKHKASFKPNFTLLGKAASCLSKTASNHSECKLLFLPITPLQLARSQLNTRRYRFENNFQSKSHVDTRTLIRGFILISLSIRIRAQLKYQSI